MALALDATSSGVNTTNQTAGGTTTVSHICTGSNRVLIVSIEAWNNGGTGTGCSGVTYNGVAMTKVTGSGSTNGAFYTEQWYLIAPTTGTNNIIATVAGKTDKLGVAGVSFTGADQTSPIDTNTTAIGTSGTVTASLTTGANSEYMVDAVSHLSANTASSGTGTSVLNDGTSGVGVATQYGAAATAGSNSLSWTYPDPGDGWAYSVLAVKAASSGTSYTKTLTESVTFSDTLVKTTGRIFTEATTITASFIRGKIFSEAITVTDTLLKTTGRTFTETVSATDMLIKTTGRVFTEAVTITASLTHVSGKVFTESISFVDTLITQLTKGTKTLTAWIAQGLTTGIWSKNTTPSDIWTPDTKKPTNWS